MEMSKEIALAKHLSCDVEDIIDKGDNIFEVDGVDYLVYDEYEVDDALYEVADQLLEQELKYIPEYLHTYFNNEGFIEDKMTDFSLISEFHYEVELEDDEFSSIYFIFEV